MNSRYWPAVAGVGIAIIVTAAMDANGLAQFSALALFPLTGLFWILQKFARQDLGLTWGDKTAYAWALAYPLLVLGSAAAIAHFFDAVDVSKTDWGKTLLNIGLMSSTGILIGLLTEEGFFRGWLWASLKRAGQSDHQVLIWTTAAFIAWHVSAITLDTGFDVPAREVPIYLINGTIIGLIWGILRMVSGSVLVPAVSHAVWNGLDYPLFGFGEKVGALGITQTHLFGPEVGIVGILLGVLFLAAFWPLYAVTAKK